MLDEAAKLLALSFDATMRSNHFVSAPIDLLRFAVDSFTCKTFTTLEKDDGYWMELRKHPAARRELGTLSARAVAFKWPRVGITRKNQIFPKTFHEQNLNRKI